MQELRDAVERLEPLPDERGDWDAVVRDARRRRPVLLGSVAGVMAVATGLFALVLFQPWSTEHKTFIERALAAVDGGPIIHAVLRHGDGVTNINLQTGEHARVHGETELWYDPRRGRIRVAARLGGTVTHESVYDEAGASRELVALGRDYRAALESGTARTAGEDIIDGERVTWVVVVAEMLPHDGGPLREWTQQIAVSQETFKPVATRDGVAGKPAAHTLQRVLELEALPADAVDLEVPKERVDEGMFQAGHEPIAVGRAADVLGRAPVWLGREHADLTLTQVNETWLRRGSAEATLLEGPAAEDAKTCRLGPGGRARIEELSEVCKRLLESRGGLRIQGDSVYVHGPTVWGDKKIGVAFGYGAAANPFAPLSDSGEPYVYVSQARDRSALLRGAAYFPPSGFVSLAGGRSGSLLVDGIYVVIHASSPELVLSAARALRPMD